MDFKSLQQLDSLSSNRIESVEDATAYVTRAALLSGITDQTLLGHFEARFAAAEFDAAKDPTRLVSDDQVAEAFNFMSREFGVPNPATITGADILDYRGVMASIFAHLFSPKSISGSRPIGAVVMLYELRYNGGVTDGVRNAAKLDRPPGSLKVRGGDIMGHISAWSPDMDPNLIGREYQIASRNYFAKRSPQEIRAFLDRVANILALPEGISP